MSDLEALQNEDIRYALIETNFSSRETRILGIYRSLSAAKNGAADIFHGSFNRREVRASKDVIHEPLISGLYIEETIACEEGA